MIPARRRPGHGTPEPCSSPHPLALAFSDPWALNGLSEATAEEDGPLARRTKDGAAPVSPPQNKHTEKYIIVYWHPNGERDHYQYLRAPSHSPYLVNYSFDLSHHPRALLGFELAHDTYFLKICGNLLEPTLVCWFRLLDWKIEGLTSCQPQRSLPLFLHNLSWIR